MPLTTPIYEQVLRDTLRKLLAQCTVAQQQQFEVIFPKGVDAVSYDRLTSAIMLCQRTIQKNREKEGITEEFVVSVDVNTTEPTQIQEQSSPSSNFKCCECGETNNELQYMSSDYCFVCINK